MLTITSYEIHKNMDCTRPGRGQFHIAAVCGDLVESEELARRRGTFRTRKEAATELARLNAELAA